MSNPLKDKVGFGGLDPKVLARAQRRLDQKVEQQGTEWVKGGVERLTKVFEKIEAGSTDYSELICSAVDLRATALSVKDSFLSEAARSLHIFAETSDPKDPVGRQLITLHIQAILSLNGLSKTDKSQDQMAEQIVTELKTAAAKLATG